MMKKNKYSFDVERFLDTVQANQLDDAAIAAIIDVNVRTIKNKRNGTTALTMPEFLAIVNAVGLDPHKFILPIESN